MPNGEIKQFISPFHTVKDFKYWSLPKAKLTEIELLKYLFHFLVISLSNLAKIVEPSHINNPTPNLKSKVDGFSWANTEVLSKQKIKMSFFIYE